MRKTSEAQLRAIRKYDTEKRSKKPIGCRLDEETMAAVDAKRGAKSRSALVEELVLKWLNRA